MVGKCKVVHKETWGMPASTFGNRYKIFLQIGHTWEIKNATLLIKGDKGICSFKMMHLCKLDD